MNHQKIDLRAIFQDAKRQVLNDSSARHSDEEVRRLYSRMTCIRFMRPLLNYASSFALLHDRPYDQKFIDLLLFNTDALESKGRHAFDPVNASLNLGYCVVKELAAATPEVTPTLLQGVFRASFPHFSNSIRACLEAYDYQKAKPELIVAVFRDLYRVLVDNADYSKIIGLIDGDFPAVNDNKASLICTELNMLFKLAVANDFPANVYALEGKSKSDAVSAVLSDVVNTVELWVKQISDDSSRKVVLASDAGVKLVQNLMNVTSDIMFDELVYQVKQSSVGGQSDNKKRHIELSRRGFVQRVGIYAEKTESIAFSFDNYVNMIGSILFQQVHATSGNMRSSLDLQINNSSLPKLVKLISSAVDGAMLRLKDYLQEVKNGGLSTQDDVEYANVRHYRSSGDITEDILDDFRIALDISQRYIKEMISRFRLPEDCRERHWFSSEIFQAIHTSVGFFRRKTEDASGLVAHLTEAIDYIVDDVDEFIKKNQLNWVSSNSGYNSTLKVQILSAMICSSVKAVAKNARIVELTYAVKPYQLRDVVRFSLMHSKQFFDDNSNGMLSGITNEGAIMVFQNLMSNISSFYCDAIYSSISNVSNDVDSRKADYIYNYHASEVDIPEMLTSILQHASKTHESVNLMRLTHLVSPVKKNDVAASSEVVAATLEAPLQNNNTIRSRTLK